MHKLRIKFPPFIPGLKGGEFLAETIKSEISKDGEGVQIRLTGSGLDIDPAGDKTGGGIMGNFRKNSKVAKGASDLNIADSFGAKFTYLPSIGSRGRSRRGV